MGHVDLIDGMYRDGFNDPLSGLVMGETAEELASRYEISRDEQDEYALKSQQRAAAAIAAGRFNDELAPLEIKDGIRNSNALPGGDGKDNVTLFAIDAH